MSVAEQIRRGRKAAGLTASELADLVGVSRAAISQWENPRTTPKLRPEHIIALARALDRPPSAFTLFGGGTVTATDELRRHPIILLRWDDLKHLSLGGKVLKDALKKPVYIDVAREISKKAVAFTVNDDSMEPEFFPGEEIVIDPDAKPSGDHDYVLVRLQGGEHLFRRFRPRDGHGAYDLVAENPNWDTVSVTPRSPAEMLGTMVEHRRRRRPR